MLSAFELAFMVYSMNVAMAFGMLASLYGDFMQAVGASIRIFELLDRKPKIPCVGGNRLDSLEGRKWIFKFLIKLAELLSCRFNCSKNTYFVEKVSSANHCFRPVNKTILCLIGAVCKKS